MPSFQRGWNSSSRSSFGIRAGAGLAVVALHAAVIGAIFMAPESRPELEEPEAIMVSVVDAPIPQIAKAEPTPEVPQPVTETPPEPQPEIEPEPEPEPELKPEPEPEPEPEPVVEKPPMPAPKPPPPKPKPKPKPQPKQDVKPEPKPETPPRQTPPSGAPEGTQAPQGPQQGPPPDQPVMVSSIEFQGARPMPNYPMASRRMREEGRVVVLVEINTQGLVERATIDASSGFPRLDESALTAARKGRFKPYTRNGVAYPAKAKIPFDFVMRN
ncbi:energy transducer TonB [Achromobacter sp. Root83]|uniref:energy transducer TonB n=1 Tax=Achromobacter sp. Root83 TaxID=1736602 RepID=UPI0007096216|nr:energy transducer TonB [Achromobacter sp. Root83]KRC76588.1 energy transducer TonB [Achromobacter sp. Root83]